MKSIETNSIHKDREILVCTTFREFNGNSNDYIQRLFLKSLREQTYQNYILVATTFGEQNVEKALVEEKIPHKIFKGHVDEFRFSSTEVLNNAISMATGNNIVLWTTCDVIFDKNFFQTINKKLPVQSIGTSYPHYIFKDIKSFSSSKNKKVFWAGLDAVFFDSELLKNNAFIKDIEKFKNKGWGYFEFFLTGLGIKYAKKMINIWPVKLSKIDNNRAINNETPIYFNTTSNHNKKVLENFIVDNGMKRDFFSWLAHYKYQPSQLMMKIISTIKIFHIEHKVKMFIKNKYTLFRIIRKAKRAFLRFFKNAKPSSYPFISGDTFRSIAHHVMDECSKINPNTVKEKDVVFVCTEFIDEFFDEIHPKINSPYKLITHNSDKNITNKYLDKIDKKIIVWFAQNVLISHSKIVPIPIGLENMSKVNAGDIKIIKKVQKDITANKIPRIMSAFNEHTNPSERKYVSSIIKQINFIDIQEKHLDQIDYFQKIKDYCFVISPPGNGIDCIRTWESMYFKTIPIVSKTVSTEYFKSLGLPMIVLNDWSELKELQEEDLLTLYRQILSASDLKPLDFEYWKNKILSS